MGQEQIKKKIQLLIEEGEKFTFTNFCYPYPDGSPYGGEDAPAWKMWKQRSYNLISEIVSKQSPIYTLARDGLTIRTQGNYFDKFDMAKAHIITALKETLDVLNNDEFNELHKTEKSKNTNTTSNKIFIVHGHDNTLKTEIENFIHSIGLEPIVLHKQADEGKTIIEKFEAHSDVGYAIILLSPDEISYLAAQENMSDSARIKEKRARPNVIFEFGYFIGKLGRNRVCCLHKGEVSLPSDLSGVIYKKVDSGIDSIGLPLIKELKAAGYTIKM